MKRLEPIWFPLSLIILLVIILLGAVHVHYERWNIKTLAEKFADNLTAQESREILIQLYEEGLCKRMEQL